MESPFVFPKVMKRLDPKRSPVSRGYREWGEERGAKDRR